MRRQCRPIRFARRSIMDEFRRYCSENRRSGGVIDLEIFAVMLQQRRGRGRRFAEMRTEIRFMKTRRKSAQYAFLKEQGVAGSGAPATRSGEGRDRGSEVALAPTPTVGTRRGVERQWAIRGAVLGAVFVWAYWPTFVTLVKTWQRVPDYSHGFFVPVMAILILWIRRGQFPGLASTGRWPGLVLIALSVTLRAVSATLYIDSIEGWSLVLWVGGAVWLLGGWRVFRWALPAVAFLLFMVPLPFSLEHTLSLRLQGMVTEMSAWVLQTLGQPALTEGNTILVGNVQLEVEQACSGLRIFLGVIALAYLYFVLVPRAWWERVVLLLSIVPIALISNSTRIVATGLLNLYVSGEAAHKFTHDIAGLVMIPFAAGLFALVLWYLGALVREVERMDVKTMVRRERAGPKGSQG